VTVETPADRTAHVPANDREVKVILYPRTVQVPEDA
jgi:hypothetical protein